MNDAAILLGIATVIMMVLFIASVTTFVGAAADLKFISGCLVVLSGASVVVIVWGFGLAVMRL